MAAVSHVRPHTALKTVDSGVAREHKRAPKRNRCRTRSMGPSRAPERELSHAPRWLESARSARWSSNSRRHHLCPQGEQSARRAGCSPCGLLWWLIRGGRRSHVELSRCWCGEASVLPRVRWAGPASSRASERERGPWWSLGRASLPQRLLAMPRLLSSVRTRQADGQQRPFSFARAPLSTYRISAA